MYKIEKRKERIVVIFFIILQTVIFIVTAMQKQYIHMDEAYSLGLASYKITEIQDNEDFYNHWHNKEYYEDYLSVQDYETGQYSQVYENQKNDVHPPLYYLLLRFAMNFTKGHFSIWSGITLNIIIFIFITIFMYLILKKLLKNEKHMEAKAIILAFISSITMASISNAIYIRMYALSTLNILILTLLHMKLLENNQLNVKLLICIGIAVLAGVLTHYYYLFYLVILYFLFLIKYIKEKKFKLLLCYTLTLISVGIISLIIFPYSIQHIFFGYRGQGAISSLVNVQGFLFKILSYLFKVNYYAFNNMLLLIIFFILFIFNHKKENKKEKKEFLRIVCLPTIFYFILTALSSPWIELRYIMPICGLVFILVIYYLYQLLENLVDEKKRNIIVSMLLCIILIAPIIFKLEPEVVYSDKKEIRQTLENELKVPAIYLLKSENNRFLDDILLFSIIEESYIAKDMKYTDTNLQAILAGKDISNGIVIFISIEQDNQKILGLVKNTTGLKNITYLERLNICRVYYIN